MDNSNPNAADRYANQTYRTLVQFLCCVRHVDGVRLSKQTDMLIQTLMGARATVRIQKQEFEKVPVILIEKYVNRPKY